MLPEQQLQLSVQESNQRSSADDFSVAVGKCWPAVVHVVWVQTLGPCGQRHDLGWPEVKPCREKQRNYKSLRHAEQMINSDGTRHLTRITAQTRRPVSSVLTTWMLTGRDGLMKSASVEMCCNLASSKIHRTVETTASPPDLQGCLRQLTGLSYGDTFWCEGDG